MVENYTIMPKTKNPQSIYCIEGDWASKPANSISVMKALDFLKSIHEINFEIKDCITKEELKARFELYRQRPYDNYGICYFACHGTNGNIHLRDNSKKQHVFSLDEVADIADGALKGRIVHFGCCNTLQNEKKARLFLEKTEAKAVCGYKNTVLFLKSTLLDILLFEKIQDFKNGGPIESRMNKLYEGMIDELGFVMYY